MQREYVTWSHDGGSSDVNPAWYRARRTALHSRQEPTLTTTLSLGGLVCSQCERSLPAHTAAIKEWRHGPLFLTGELDREAAALLLCPECVEDEHSRAFDEGGQE